MTWGRMDDKFYRNAKVRKLRRMKGGREAIGAWAYWWSWCLDDPKLDGFIPAGELEDAGDLRSAELLASDLSEGRGLWVKVDGGFRIHDFHSYNPTKEQVEHKRDSDRKRQAGKRGSAQNESESRASRERVASDNEASRDNVASDSKANNGGLADDSLPTRASHSHSYSPCSPPCPESDQAEAPPKLDPLRFRLDLELEVGRLFGELDQTPQNAANSQWQHGCKTIQAALDKGFYADWREAMGALAGKLVSECQKPGRKLGLALMDTQLSRPGATAPGGRKYSGAAVEEMSRARREGV